MEIHLVCYDDKNHDSYTYFTTQRKCETLQEWASTLQQRFQ